MTPGPRPSIGTPAAKAPPRYGSPTNRFAQSVRGTAGDPSKKTSKLERKPSIGPRSASAMGGALSFDEDPLPPAPLHSNGMYHSASTMNLKMQPPPSRVNGNDDEVERLRSQLEDRDRQLRDQAATLADMEGSLVELQTLIGSSDGPKFERSDLDDKDSAQLRAMLREKNDKIAMLTAEFSTLR